VARIDRLHPVTSSAVVLGLVVVLTVIDYQLGAERSLGAAHLLPAGLAVWAFGRMVGLATALVSAVCWTAVANYAPASGVPPAPAWTLLSNSLLFVLAAMGLWAFRVAYAHERGMARSDELTGLPNRHAFVERARVELERARRGGHPLSVAFIDVDDFKLLNDRLGHSAGDGALRAVAGELLAGARSLDLVARLGGDEFAVLLPGLDGPEAGAAAARLHGAASLSCSAGCVTWRALPADIDELLRQADAVMYAVKREGKGRLRHEIIDRRVGG
jgi:diguanylate cyclase (GGDEF)-like protein